MVWDHSKCRGHEVHLPACSCKLPCQLFWVAAHVLTALGPMASALGLRFFPTILFPPTPVRRLLPCLSASAVCCTAPWATLCTWAYAGDSAMSHLHYVAARQLGKCKLPPHWPPAIQARACGVVNSTTIARGDVTTYQAIRYQSLSYVLTYQALLFL